MLVIGFFIAVVGVLMAIYKKELGLPALHYIGIIFVVSGALIQLAAVLKGWGDMTSNRTEE